MTRVIGTAIPSHKHGKYNRMHLVTAKHRGMTAKEASNHKTLAKKAIMRELAELLS